MSDRLHLSALKRDPRRIVPRAEWSIVLISVLVVNAYLLSSRLSRAPALSPPIYEVGNSAASVREQTGDQIVVSDIRVHSKANSAGSHEFAVILKNHSRQAVCIMGANVSCQDAGCITIGNLPMWIGPADQGSVEGTMQFSKRSSRPFHLVIYTSLGIRATCEVDLFRPSS
jgi:hypothetical protein